MDFDFCPELRNILTMQILTLKDNPSEDVPEDRQGKMLIHTEYSLLSMLADQDGVVHHYGLFQVSLSLYMYISLYIDIHYL